MERVPNDRTLEHDQLCLNKVDFDLGIKRLIIFITVKVFISTKMKTVINQINRVDVTNGRPYDIRQSPYHKLTSIKEHLPAQISPQVICITSFYSVYYMYHLLIDVVDQFFLV